MFYVNGNVSFSLSSIDILFPIHLNFNENKNKRKMVAFIKWINLQKTEKPTASTAHFLTHSHSKRGITVSIFKKTANGNQKQNYK